MAFVFVIATYMDKCINIYTQHAESACVYMISGLTTCCPIRALSLGETNSYVLCNISCVLIAYMSVYRMRLWCLQMPEEGTRSETRVTDSCGPDWEGMWTAAQ